MEEKRKNSIARINANRRYNEKAYDRFSLTFKKGYKDELKAIAEKEGYSLNSFINEAIQEKIERLGGKE